MTFLLLAAAVLGLHGSPHTVRTNHTWTCRQHVDLELVHVSIPAGPREDAVHLRSGCTGRIGRLEIEQRSGDGVKVADGVHDLVVGGGEIRCLAKAPTVHQDGIQVMGGEHILFRNLTISCGRRDSRLVNSNLFIKQGLHSSQPPRDVVCDACAFGAWAAHTVSVQSSIRSGVTDSRICVARFPQLTLAVGLDAISPQVSGNHVRQCGSGMLTLEPHQRVVEFGRPLVLHGLFLGRLGRTKVTAEARPVGSRRFVRADATSTRPTGRFKLVLRPPIGETVRLRSGSLQGPRTRVLVSPRVVVRVRGHGVVVKVRAGRSYAGRVVLLRALRQHRWVTVQRMRLTRKSRAQFDPGLHGVRVRVVVPRAPGYVAAHSDAVRLS
ncbi:MAG TPA: hypothetical protein VE757_04200 [Gaiellaceae bacterium]|nr:hypothetical protein [Gaiellaceae bacterium]